MQEPATDGGETDAAQVLPFAEYVRHLADGGENIEAAEAALRDELQGELAAGDYDVYMDDYDTCVVDTPSFTAGHRVDPDGRGVGVSEESTYVHDETDFEIDAVGPVDEIRDAAYEYQNGEHPGEAALTVGERNPGLGGNRRL